MRFSYLDVLSFLQLCGLGQAVHPRQTASYNNGTRTTTSATTTITPAPCCWILAREDFSAIGINSWWSTSTEQVVATVITTFLEYDDTIVAANSTTKYLPKNQAWTSYGFYGGISGGSVSIPGVPADLTADLMGTTPPALVYAGTSVVPGNATTVAFDFTDVVIASPTPYQLWNLEVLAYYPTITSYSSAPLSTYAPEMCGSFQDVYIPGNGSEYITSTRLAPPLLVNDRQFMTQLLSFNYVERATTALPSYYQYLEVPQAAFSSLKNNKTVRSRIPYIDQCRPWEGAGQPTVHVPVNQLTEMSSVTMTINKPNITYLSPAIKSTVTTLLDSTLTITFGLPDEEKSTTSQLTPMSAVEKSTVTTLLDSTPTVTFGLPDESETTATVAPKPETKTTVTTLLDSMPTITFGLPDESDSTTTRAPKSSAIKSTVTELIDQTTQTLIFDPTTAFSPARKTSVTDLLDTMPTVTFIFEPDQTYTLDTPSVEIGDSTLEAPTISTRVPAQSAPEGGQQVAIPISGFVIGSQTAIPGGFAIVDQQTTYSALPSNQGVEVVANGETQTIVPTPALLPGSATTVDGTTYSALSFGSGTLVIANDQTQTIVPSPTLLPGSTTTIDGTTYSALSSGSGVVIIADGITRTQAAGITPIPISPTGGYALSSQTLLPGGPPVVLDGTTYTIPTSDPSEIVAIEAGETRTYTADADGEIPLPSVTASPLTPQGGVITIDGEEVSCQILGNSAVVVDGSTLSLNGPPVTIDGETLSLVAQPSGSGIEIVAVDATETERITLSPIATRTSIPLIPSGSGFGGIISGGFDGGNAGAGPSSGPYTGGAATYSWSWLAAITLVAALAAL